MIGAGWELFPHDADTGVRGYGPTVEAAFEQSASALTGVITDPAKVVPTQRIRVVCEGGDPDQLLFDWLNTIIFEMATRHMLFGRFEVTFDGARPRSPKNH